MCLAQGPQRSDAGEARTKFYCILTSVVSDEPVQPPFKLRNSKCFGQWPSVQATIKGSDQTAHMRRLV